MDLKPDWLASIQSVLKRAESAECDLSYLSVSGSEQERKHLGSYYTPIDVARFFWNEFFRLASRNWLKSPEDLLNGYTFVEPAVGAGSLVFALLEKLICLGLCTQKVAEIRIELVDVNKAALSFVNERLNDLEKEWNVSFSNVILRQGDFLTQEFGNLKLPIILFGNPPFVTSRNGSSGWRNIYADFVDAALRHAGSDGAIHFITPLSIAFSSNYENLRNALFQRGGTLAFSHFDNIPDTLFKFGKPRQINTNKANSQRCSIVSAFPSSKKEVLSTRLHRWRSKEREAILTGAPSYYDVSDLWGVGQVVRPNSVSILRYVRSALGCQVLGAFAYDRGEFALNVAGVARNFIGVREEEAVGTHVLRFRSQDDMLRVLNIICSDVFMDYWLSVGDGFHLTKSNLFQFPVGRTMLEKVNANLSLVKDIWRVRNCFAKSKLNSGRVTTSYDFTKAFPTLYEIA